MGTLKVVIGACAEQNTPGRTRFVDWHEEPGWEPLTATVNAPDIQKMRLRASLEAQSTVDGV